MSKLYDIEGRQLLLHEGRLYQEVVPTSDTEKAAFVANMSAKIAGRKSAGGGRKCSNCGETGHQARTCPDAEKPKDEDDED